jgi:hypothetical protein
MKNNLLGKNFLSCSFYLYRFRKYVSCGFPIIHFCNLGVHYETPCIIVLQSVPVSPNCCLPCRPKSYSLATCHAHLVFGWVIQTAFSEDYTSYEAVVMFAVQPSVTCPLVGYPVLRYAAVFVGLEVSAARKDRVVNWARRSFA